MRLHRLPVMYRQQQTIQFTMSLPLKQIDRLVEDITEHLTPDDITNVSSPEWPDQLELLCSGVEDTLPIVTQEVHEPDGTSLVTLETSIEEQEDNKTSHSYRDYNNMTLSGLLSSPGNHRTHSDNSGQRSLITTQLVGPKTSLDSPPYHGTHDREITDFEAPTAPLVSEDHLPTSSVATVPTTGTVSQDGSYCLGFSA